MEVPILGVGMTPFGRHPDKSLRSLARAAASAALADSALTPGDIDLLVFANSFEGVLSGQESIRGEVVFGTEGFGGSTMVLNVENACASGSSAVGVACSYIAAGNARRALVVGAEKLFQEDRARSFAALRSATDVSLDVEGGPGRSVFMDHYARKACAYMEAYGATPEDFARVAVKNGRNGARNPLAHHRAEHTIEGVLTAREVTPPLTLLMCSPVSDGAAAIVLGGEGDDATGRPRIVASSIIAGDGVSDPTAAAARRAFATARIMPGDVDVAEVHDATAPSELLALEDLGLCPVGEAAPWTASGATAVGGELAVNPSGGLLARGHPIGATGVAQIVELTWQLRGMAGERQVPDPEIGIAHNAGGVLRDDVAVASVTVIRR